MFAALRDCFSQPYFWFVAVLPIALATIAALHHRHELPANRAIWLVATLLAMASAFTSGLSCAP